MTDEDARKISEFWVKLRSPKYEVNQWLIALIFFWVMVVSLLSLVLMAEFTFNQELIH